MSPVNTGAESSTAGLPEPLRKPCLRCLLREMPDQAQLSAVLRELIDGIPPEDRSPAALTESRLQICRDCPHLRQGTCGLCGCYVEHRAEKRKAVCPAGFWLPLPDPDGIEGA